jgi:muramoyltetrapeptide carboxypeptidase LdcA involved in peptidoglycan recycling
MKSLDITYKSIKNSAEHFGFSKDDPFGMSAEEIILGYVKELGIPVMVGAPVGHIRENRPIILGAIHQLRVDQVLSGLTS